MRSIAENDLGTPARESARQVTLNIDGRAVTVSRIAGSAPPGFTGESLDFTVGENGARLSQDEAANELRCNPA